MKIMVHYYLIKYGIYMDINILIMCYMDSLDKTFSVENTGLKFNVRLAGGHLYGKQLFTWLSLVVFLMASFVLSFFPLDVLDEIWDLIESASEGFLTYS